LLRSETRDRRPDETFFTKVGAAKRYWRRMRLKGKYRG